jgi:hypothetical protein
MAKRETNAQRAAREYNHRTTLLMAGHIAELIRERRENKLDLAPEDMEDLPAKKLKAFGWHPESKRWRKDYAFLGQVFCEFCPFDENPSKFLRLVADFLEEKRPPYSPGNDWYDAAIIKAYRQVPPRMSPFEGKHGGLEAYVIIYPSFSEFSEVFRKQNPKLRGASDRSLRRSLKRMGYRIEPAKRGRPRNK